MTLKELFTNIANAIRSATGATGTIKATDFASKISAITNRGAWTSTINAGGSVTVPAGYHNGSGKVTANANSGNAGTSQVLSGYTFYSNSATKQTGTMTNRGAVSTTISPGGSYTIPAGYHNGSGVVSASSGLYGSPSMQTATNGNQQATTRTATVSFSGKVVTVSGFGYSNNSNPSISIEILVNGSWVTCSSSNGTIITTRTGSDRNLIAQVWANSGSYRNSTISGARVTNTNGYSDGWGGSHCIAVVV